MSCLLVFKAQVLFQLPVVLFLKGQEAEDLEGTVPGQALLVGGIADEGIPLDGRFRVMEQDPYIVPSGIVVGVGFPL